MRLLVVNPNTTAAMTARLVEEAARFAGPGWTVEGATARFGHEVIASRVSFAIGAHAALDAYQAHAAEHGRPDAVLLGCFGDPGLAALREAAGVPVAGLAQAAIRAAMRGTQRIQATAAEQSAHGTQPARGVQRLPSVRAKQSTQGAQGSPHQSEGEAESQRFAIVTAGAAWRAMLEETVLLERAERQLVDIYVLDTTGLAVARDPAGFRARVQALAETAQAAGAQSVILGGAGFAGMARELPPALSAIDCIEAGTRAAVQAAAPE